MIFGGRRSFLQSRQDCGFAPGEAYQFGWSHEVVRARCGARLRCHLDPIQEQLHGPAPGLRDSRVTACRALICIIASRLETVASGCHKAT